MTIQDAINQDPRVAEIKKTYNTLMTKKQNLILEIGAVEADIIKVSGIYETIAKEVVAALQKAPVAPVEETEPVEPEQVTEYDNEGNEVNVVQDFPFEGGVKAPEEA